MSATIPDTTANCPDRIKCAHWMKSPPNTEHTLRWRTMTWTPSLSHKTTGSGGRIFTATSGPTAPSPSHLNQTPRGLVFDGKREADPVSQCAVRHATCLTPPRAPHSRPGSSPRGWCSSPGWTGSRAGSWGSSRSRCRRSRRRCGSRARGPPWAARSLSSRWPGMSESGKWQLWEQSDARNNSLFLHKLE